MKTCSIDHCPRPPQGKLGLCQAHYFYAWSGKDPSLKFFEALDLRECLVLDCAIEQRSNGLCGSHITAVKLGRMAAPEGATQRVNPTCSFDGCETVSTAKGLCPGHYYQASKGYPLTAILPPEPKAERAYGAPRFCPGPNCQIRLVIAGSLLCAKHAAQELAYGITWPIGELRPIEIVDCAFVGCENFATENATLCSRHHQRAKRFGLSHAEFLAMLDGASCEVCGSSERLIIDHDHSCCAGDTKTGCGNCNRGILCNGCNTALGFLKDDPERIFALAEYIQRTALTLAA
jgi:hypothetical protein